MNSSKLKKQSVIGEFSSYSIPAIVSMLLSASIVLVDGIFIGKGIGHAGLAAVNLTLPVFYIFLGAGVMISVGGSIIASHKRGAGRKEEANIVFSNSMTILAAVIMIMLILFRLFFEAVLFCLKAEGILYQYVREYLGAILWFYPLNVLSIGLSVFIRTEGKAVLSMIFGFIGTIMNAVFDYLFIIKMGWGLTGAALASGIAIIVPLVCSAVYFKSKKSFFSFVRPRLEKAQIRNIFYNGSSEMISQLSVAFTTWLFNWVILRRLGIDGLAAFTIVGYLIFIEAMIITGFATGLGPLAGFYFGAGDRPRIIRILKLALGVGFLSGLLSWGIVILIGGSFATAVSGGNKMVGEIASSGYWIFTSAFLFNGLNVISSAFFSSLGKARQSLMISSLRGLILNSLAVICLPVFLGDKGIWLSLPVAELLTLLITQRILRSTVAELTEEHTRWPAAVS